MNDDAEKAKYEAENPGVEILVSNKQGCMPNRNFLLNHFPAGFRILMVDDDVEGLFEMRGPGREGLVKMTGDEVDALILKGFDLCEKNKTKFWGVYPTYNHYFMSRTIVPHGVIVGMFMGIIVSDERFDRDKDGHVVYKYRPYKGKDYTYLVNLINILKSNMGVIWV